MLTGWVRLAPEHGLEEHLLSSIFNYNPRNLSLSLTVILSTRNLNEVELETNENVQHQNL